MGLFNPPPLLQAGKFSHPVSMLLYRLQAGVKTRKDKQEVKLWRKNQAGPSGSQTGTLLTSKNSISLRSMERSHHHLLTGSPAVSPIGDSQEVGEIGGP